MPTLESLIAKQVNVAGYIQRFFDNTKKTKTSSVTKGFLEARISLLEKYFEEFSNRNGEIEALNIGTASPYFTEDMYGTTELCYTEVKGHLLDWIETFQPTRQSVPTMVPTMLFEETASTSSRHELPRIPLPKFDGTYSGWESFSDLFKTMVHENGAVSDVHKLHYLKLSISGEAASLLKNLKLTNANYNLAWSTLVDRYENKISQLNTYMHEWFSIQPVKNDSSQEFKRVVDSTLEVLGSIENMNRPVNSWDDVIIYVTLNKLGSSIRKDWQHYHAKLNRKELPSLDDFKKYLEVQRMALENCTAPTTLLLPLNSDRPSKLSTTSSTTRSLPERRSAYSTTYETAICPSCKGDHLLLFCSRFRYLTVPQRRECVSNLRVCSNCLRPDHFYRSCLSPKRCQKCHQKHHTMLHQDHPPATSHQNHHTAIPQMPQQDHVSTGQLSSLPPSSAVDSKAFPDPTSLKSTGASTSSSFSVVHFQQGDLPTRRSPALLATALVNVFSSTGHHMQARALLDLGSEESFISERLTQLLHLKKTSTQLSFYGLGDQPIGSGKHAVCFQIGSHNNSTQRFSVEAVVLKKVTGMVPSQRVIPGHWPHIKGLQLADPQYEIPGRIDLLLGANVYADLLETGLLRGPTGTPLAQQTALGWVLFGATNSSNSQKVKTYAHNVRRIDETSVKDLLQRFWELEELPTSSSLTPDEKECESHFSATHYRDATGRYVVRLPFRQSTLPIDIGESRQAARFQLLRLEHRLSKDSTYSLLYRDFLAEYAYLGHMKPAPASQSPPYYYIPHHGILKASSSTTKLRVVFNASMPSTNGKSLNDYLHKGPKLQQDLFTIILRWRRHRIVLTADVEKMYRQIRIHDDDAPFQQILWRDHESHDVSAFYLNTVTYGTTCAPYLAIKVCHQLASDEHARFPQASEVLLRDFFVDDLFTGSDTVESAIKLCNETNSLLTAGGFKLRKWSSNFLNVVSHLPTEDLASFHSKALPVGEDFRALGIFWCNERDIFYFCEPTWEVPTNMTKRNVLSGASRLFDPLGWVTPVTIRAKILLQDLWFCKYDWDDLFNESLQRLWRDYFSALRELPKIAIPRWIGLTQNANSWELHGFCDASSRAYAAVVYSRVTNNDHSVRISMLTAKSKVAPIQTISIPRLELCAAHLLTKLLSHVQNALGSEAVPIYTWTDSTIVLYWLRSHSCSYKTFVANRVSNIQTTLPSAQWRHVSSNDNPADIASRGTDPTTLSLHSIWFQGPSWLQNPSDTWPHEPSANVNSTELEHKIPVQTYRVQVDNQTFDLLDRYSCLSRLYRITAYCLRFSSNCQTQPDCRTTGPLSPDEISRAEIALIKRVQQTTFSSELKQLSAGVDIARHSRILTLTPFVHVDGVLRVGGRLHHSLLPFTEQHPALLPYDSPLTRLIVAQVHKDTLHGGPLLMLSTIRQRFWILRGRDLVRRHVQRCIRCIRFAAKFQTQLMGQLPSDRVIPSRPFSIIGVDYAGPVLLRTTKGRGHKAYKAWIAVFVCFTTKAIHLEPVSDCTTETFLAAFRRLTSRRGTPHTIWSDNATTFKGADRTLQGLQSQNELQWPHIINQLSTEGISWHYIPPGAPHAGGLWEAGVKSTKHHLRRAIGDSTLTFEEMATLLSQIEACLNSRPLTSMSSDPNDMQALTPGHFIIGTAINALPTTPSVNETSKLLPRWHQVQQRTQQFWRYWSQDYLQQMQQRIKWKVTRNNVKSGDLVLIKNELLPPTKWELGRVLTVHPGQDGLVRSVKVKTSSTILLRPVTKLCILPVA